MPEQNALPDLVSRLRLDITAASADLALVKAQVEGVGNTGETAGAKAAAGMDVLKKGLDGVIARAAAAAEAVGHVGEVVARSVEGGGITGLLGGLGGSLPIIGAATAGVVGLFAAIEHLTNETATYSASVLRNSEILGLNSDTYQGLYQAANKFGIEQEDLLRTLERFQRNLEDGGSALRTLGLSLSDVGITSTDTGTALNQLSTYLHDNTDEAQRNAVGLALLGRNGVALSEVLSKGPAFLQGYTQELKTYGVVLDDSQLKTGALAKTVHDQLGLTLQGIEFQVGTQLESAFTQLWLAIVKGAGGSKALFDDIAKAISNVVGWVAGLIQGLTGVTVTLGDVNAAASSYTGALNDLAAANAGAATPTTSLKNALADQQGALDKLRQSTQLQTAALDDQIKTLQDTAQAQQEAMRAAQQAAEQALADARSRGSQNQRDADAAALQALRDRNAVAMQVLRDQSTAEQQAVRDHLAGVEQEVRMSQLLQQQQDEQHTSYLSQLQDELDRLNDTTDSRRHSGETLVAYEERLQRQQIEDKIKQEQNRRAEEKTSTDITLEVLRTETAATLQAMQDQTQAQEQALSDQQRQQEQALADQQRAAEQAYSDQTKAMTQALHDQDAANLKSATEQTKDRVAALEAQKANLNRALQQQSDAVQQATLAQRASYDQLTGGVVGDANTMAGGLVNAIAGKDGALPKLDLAISSSAVQWGKDIRGAFQDPGGQLGPLAAHLAGEVIGGFAQGAMDAFGHLSPAEQALAGAAIGGRYGGAYGAAIGAIIGVTAGAAASQGGPFNPNNAPTGGSYGDMAGPGNPWGLSAEQQGTINGDGTFTTPDGVVHQPMPVTGSAGTFTVGPGGQQTYTPPGAGTGGGIARAAGGPIDGAFAMRHGVTAAASGAALGDGAAALRGAYMVGERGPELRTFDQPGNIISNDRLRQALGGGGDFHQYVAFNGPVADEYVARRVMDELHDDAMRRNLGTIGRVA